MNQVYLTVILCVLFSLSANAQTTYDSTGVEGDILKGWTLVRQSGKFGFIDKKGNEIVAPQYDYIEGFGEYRKSWCLVKKGNYLGFIDNKGKEIVPTEYQSFGQVGEYGNEIPATNKHGRNGYVDRKGKFNDLEDYH